MVGTSSVLQELGDTMMMSAAPCRIRTPGRERAALHSMAIPPAHEKRGDRRRAGNHRGPAYSACTRVGRWRVARYSMASPCRTRLQFSKARTNAYRVREQNWSRWWLIRSGMRSHTTSEWTRRECAGRNGSGEASAWEGIHWLELLSICPTAGMVCSHDPSWLAPRY